MEISSRLQPWLLVSELLFWKSAFKAELNGLVIFFERMAIIDSVTSSAVLINSEYHDLFTVYPIMAGQ
jgi:hypothetical protein